MLFLIPFLIIPFAVANRNASRWNIHMSQKQGPNVCAVEVNPELNYAYYTDGKYWRPRTICGRQTIIRYECCSGYYRVPGYAGCIGVKPLINVIETSRRLGSSKFAKLIEGSRFAEELRGGRAITLFAPTDDALDEYLRAKGIAANSLYDVGFQDSLIANHIIGRRVESRHWDSDFLLPSQLRDHFLRVNKFSNGIETVNCQRIVRKDQGAINGIVHVIDGVLDPAVAYSSDVIDLAARDGRFSIFIRAFESSDLRNRIGHNEIPYTIFAPTDEAFRNIPPSQLNNLLSDPTALNVLIANHIVPHPVCIANIISEYHSRTIIQRREISFNCEAEGATVDHVNLGHEMFHGYNGLMYILNRVLLPDRAKSVLQIAKKEGLHTFLQVVRAAGLEEGLIHLQDYTMFVPSEAAMHSMPESQFIELQKNQEEARQFVLDHIVRGKHFTESISSNQIVRTLNEGLPLRFQVYRDAYGIENALILKSDKEASNSVVHVISHILHPTRESLDNILRTDGNFSIWLEAMDKIKHTNPELYRDLKGNNSSCTYFVPSDNAFKKLGANKLRNLMEDSRHLAKTLKNHIVDNMLISESFKDDLQYSIPTRQGVVNIIRKNNELHVNDASLVKSDILNKDGVAHEINAVLLPPTCTRVYRRKYDGSVVKTCV